MNFLPKAELYEMLGLDLGKKLITCTFHPEIVSNRIIPAFVKKVLEEIINITDYQILITVSNIDMEGDKYSFGANARNFPNIVYIKSLLQNLKKLSNSKLL